MPTPKDEAIKVRIPQPVKAALIDLADNRLSTLSEITRDALIEYIDRHGGDRKTLAAKARRRRPVSSA